MSDSSDGRATTLVLVRHGHTADNGRDPHRRLSGWADGPLSPLGQAQVQALCAHLRTEPRPAALYASPLRRARATADALSSTLGVPVRVWDDLREISGGVLDGLPLEEVKRRYPELWQRNLAQTDEDFHWPGGESYRAFRERAVSAMRRIADAHPGERVLIVTHTGVITQVLGALRGTSAARWGDCRVGNATLSEVLWTAEAPTVTRFDERTHLAEIAT